MLPKKADTAKNAAGSRNFATLYGLQAWRTPCQPCCHHVEPAATTKPANAVATLRDCGTITWLDCAFWLKFSRQAWDRMYMITEAYFAASRVTSNIRLFARAMGSAMPDFLAFAWVAPCGTLSSKSVPLLDGDEDPCSVDSSEVRQRITRLKFEGSKPCSRSGRLACSVRGGLTPRRRWIRSTFSLPVWKIKADSTIVGAIMKDCMARLLKSYRCSTGSEIDVCNRLATT
mmetsp:Transcript_38541/g.116516  ORF Transcript_38541/g.116516 Transcript_38541/m.116516 type:complete len:230 (-) Transcript_38541:1183-1872(-)